MDIKPVMNLGNSIVGVSILAMPYCFSQCGIILGTLLLVVSALFTMWSCKMLVRAALMTRQHTYETLALGVFGKPGKLCIELSIIGLNLGTCIAFFVIIGDLAPPIVAQATGIGWTPSFLRAVILILAALFIAFPLGLLRSIDSLSAISMCSLLFYSFLIVQLFYLSFKNFAAGTWASSAVWWDTSKLLKCLPIFSLAFACHTQMFVIYNQIQGVNIRRMSYIITSAISMVATGYFLVASFGYVTFCKEAVSGDVLKNFQMSLISQLTRFGFALSVVVSFPLMIFPCRVSINSLFCSSAALELHVQEPIPQNRFIAITALIIGTTLSVAILIPNVETVLALTGATMGSLISYIFPGILFLKVAGSKADYSRKAKVCVFVGACVMLLSTVVLLNSENGATEINSMKPPRPFIDEIVKQPQSSPHKVPFVPVVDDQKIAGGAKKEPPDDKNKDSVHHVINEGVKNVDAANDRGLPPDADHRDKDLDPGDKKPVVQEQNPQVDLPPDKQAPDQQPPNEPDADKKAVAPAGNDVIGNRVPDIDRGLEKEKKVEDSALVVAGQKTPEDVHVKLQKDMSALNKRIGDLEVENRDLKQRQEIIEKHAEEDSKQHPGDQEKVEHQNDLLLVNKEAVALHERGQGNEGDAGEPAQAKREGEDSEQVDRPKDIAGQVDHEVIAGQVDRPEAIAGHPDPLAEQVHHPDSLLGQLDRPDPLAAGQVDGDQLQVGRDNSLILEKLVKEVEQQKSVKNEREVPEQLPDGDEAVVIDLANPNALEAAGDEAVVIDLANPNALEAAGDNERNNEQKALGDAHGVLGNAEQAPDRPRDEDLDRNEKVMGVRRDLKADGAILKHEELS